MKIRIQSTNIYYKNSDPRLSLRRARRYSTIPRPDSIGIQEGGYPLHKGLKNFKGYRAYWRKSKNVHVRNNVTLLKKAPRIKFIGRRWIKTADGAGTGVTPQRNMFIVRYTKRGQKIAHINSHMHVIPEEWLATVPERQWGKAARQYRNHAKLLLKHMRRLRRNGHIVFLTVDANARPKHGHKDWEYSLYKYLDVGVWKTIRTGVDMLVYDSSAVTLNRHNIIPISQMGQADHPTIIAEFTTRKKGIFVRLLNRLKKSKKKS